MARYFWRKGRAALPRGGLISSPRLRPCLTVATAPGANSRRITSSALDRFATHDARANKKATWIHLNEPTRENFKRVPLFVRSHPGQVKCRLHHRPPKPPTLPHNVAWIGRITQYAVVDQDCVRIEGSSTPRMYDLLKQPAVRPNISEKLSIRAAMWLASGIARRLTGHAMADPWTFASHTPPPTSLEAPPVGIDDALIPPSTLPYPNRLNADFPHRSEVSHWPRASHRSAGSCAGKTGGLCRCFGLSCFSS